MTRITDRLYWFGRAGITNYHSTQWRYMDFQGHTHHLESLKKVRELGVDLILPGHGAPFQPTDADLERLQKKMERLYELFYHRPYEYFRVKFRRITSHVYEVSNSMAFSYVVLDGRRHAVLIDCGFTSTHPITANPHRFIDHLTPQLEGELGVRSVERFLPSHYHDDHLAGYPALRLRYGTKVACSPELKGILEHPADYEMPCLVPDEIKVHRVIRRGKAFEWKGIRFYMEQHPRETLSLRR